MTPETNPLKYLPLIGTAIFLVFWGASQAVQAYAENEHKPKVAAPRGALTGASPPPYKESRHVRPKLS